MSATPLRTTLSAPIRKEIVVGMRQKFFFLTVSGGIRLLEFFLSCVHVGVFGYYGTFYDKVSEITVAPLFLASARETLFVFVNFHTMLSNFTIVVSSLISAKSHTALLGSLYLFVFDVLQCFLLLASSAALIMMYMDEETRKILGQSTTTRQGLSVTGMILGCLHLIGAVYDITIYLKRTQSRIMQI